MYNFIRILLSVVPQTHSRSLNSPRQMGLGVLAVSLYSLIIGFSPQPTLAKDEGANTVQNTQTAAPTNVPPALTEQLAKVDQAANQQDLAKLIDFYSPNFVSGDGLNRKALQQVITQFWQDYSNLTYKTELVNWEKKAQGYVVETKTIITGIQTLERGPVRLKSTLHSQQHWIGNQITKQDILAERSQLSAGKKPPKVQVILPQEVAVGEKFEFDVIVDEPLGNNPLLGLALEEPITMKNYLNQPELKLELLPAGGLFKVGTAGNQPTSEWISAVLVQDGGMTIISQRLNVVLQKKSAEQSRK